MSLGEICVRSKVYNPTPHPSRAVGTIRTRSAHVDSTAFSTQLSTGSPTVGLRKTISVFGELLISVNPGHELTANTVMCEQNFGDGEEDSIGH